MLAEESGDFGFLLGTHDPHFEEVGARRDDDVFDAAEIEVASLFDGVEEEVGEVAGLEEGEHIMDGVAGLFGGAVGGGVLVDFLAELAHGGLAVGDVGQEGRLDMDHGGNQIILTFQREQ